MYIAITQIDADTGIICTQEPMRTGPTYPNVKGCSIEFNNRSMWPIPTTVTGAYAVAPLFFGTCDDDADITLPGVVATYTEEEYLSLQTTEHLARKPFPSWVGDISTMSWQAPSSMPEDDKRYYWDEETTSWVEDK
jgi:hypothetical protein